MDEVNLILKDKFIEIHNIDRRQANAFVMCYDDKNWE
jgi:hypothetical protein